MNMTSAAAKYSPIQTAAPAVMAIVRWDERQVDTGDGADDAEQVEEQQDADRDAQRDVADPLQQPVAVRVAVAVVVEVRAH